MFHYLIKITDNTFIPVITLALLLALLNRNKGGARGKFYFSAALAGAGAALVYAFLKRTTGIAVREYYDLGVMLPSLAASAILLLTVWGAGRAKQGLNSLLFRIAAWLALAVWLAALLPNILLYPFEFAVGMDTIFNADFLGRVVGYAAGLLLMLLCGLLTFKTAARLPARLTAGAFAFALLVLAGQQDLSVAQILLARNMIGYSDLVMNLVLFMLNYSNWFIYAQMAAALFLAAALLLQVKFTALKGNNPAEIRKMKATARQKRRCCLTLAVCLLAVVLTATVIRAYDGREAEISPPEEIPASGDKILIPLEQINDGNLHRFMYKSLSGVEVRYIVIKKSESAYGVGLDACDICGPSGYYQRKDQVICKLCDVVMNISTIGFPGGCNPVPLRFSIAQGRMIILLEDLEAEAHRFE